MQRLEESHTSESVVSEGAFKNCTSLEEITITKNIVILGDNRLMECTALQSVSVMGPVISLGTNVFAVCSCLTKVKVPPTRHLTYSTIHQEAEVCIQRVEGLYPDLSSQLPQEPQTQCHND